MTKPDVSDHAVIRYLERVHRIEMDAIRAEISQLCELGHSLGANVVRLGNLEYLIEGGVVVTVQLHGRPDRRRPRARRSSDGDA